MKRKDNVFAMLTALVAADCVLTTIAVGYMGMLEPNPLFSMFGGVWSFMPLKIFVSALCLVSMYVLSKSDPAISGLLAGLLCVMYGGVVLGGIVLIIWSVI